MLPPKPSVSITSNHMSTTTKSSIPAHCNNKGVQGVKFESCLHLDYTIPFLCSRKIVEKRCRWMCNAKPSGLRAENKSWGRHWVYWDFPKRTGSSGILSFNSHLCFSHQPVWYWWVFASPAEAEGKKSKNITPEFCGEDRLLHWLGTALFPNRCHENYYNADTFLSHPTYSQKIGKENLPLWCSCVGHFKSKTVLVDGVTVQWEGHMLACC